MIKVRYFFVHLIWSIVCWIEWLGFKRAIKHGKRTQMAYLRTLLHENRATLYGINHNFNELKTYAQFKDTVPITVYEDYKPYMDLIESGKNLEALSKSGVTLLEPTSGSTSATKLIPYTKPLSKEFQKGIGPWLFDLYRHRKMRFTGTSYWSISPLMKGETYTESGIPIGFEEDSQYFGKLGEKLINQILCVPKEVRAITSVESFKYVTILFLLRDQNLNLISVWNPTFLLLLLKKMETNWDALLKDIEHGTITLENAESDEVLSNLKRKIKPKRKRAAYLSSLSSKDIAGIWPKLRLVSCWSEANAEPYYQELKAKLGPIEIQGKGLLATECFISFPLVKASHSILALNSHFFEFLPLEEPRDDTKLFHELTVGAQYIPIVTTGGGLYRYNTNDVVEVKGFKQGVPLLKFTGRKDRVSDHFGEKLNEAHVTETLSHIFNNYSLNPTFYMVAFDDCDRIPHYTLYMETDAVDINIVKEIDQRLEANFHYRYSKDLGQLGNLRLFLIDSDGLDTYTRRLQENGMKLGDIKPATLSAYTNWHACFKGDFIAEGSS